VLSTENFQNRSYEIKGGVGEGSTVEKDGGVETESEESR
jgi:hypothetical protein